jgi:tRNA(His) 5'-end guanylyltransferase
MKSYEEATNYIIAPRLPIMGRIDGKAFHTLTKKLKCDKPFDERLARLMSEASRFLSSQVQGCVISYTQSDEISFAIRTDQSQDSQPWFGNRIQKIVSVATSAVSAVFNRHMSEEEPFAMFDCRVWYMPSMVEVQNYFVWRQRDCVKNSISSAAYYEIARAVSPDGTSYGRKRTDRMLHKLNQDERQELLFSKASINWNNYPDRFKRGIVIFRKDVEVETDHGPIMRKRWTAEPAPHFTSEDGRVWLTEVLNPPRREETDGTTENQSGQSKANKKDKSSR